MFGWLCWEIRTRWVKTYVIFFFLLNKNMNHSKNMNRSKTYESFQTYESFKTYESLLSQVRERRCTRSGQMLLARHLAAAVVEHHPEQHQFELFLQRTLVHCARRHAHFGRHCGECMICLFCYPCCFIQNTYKLIPFVCLLPVLFYSKHI